MEALCHHAATAALAVTIPTCAGATDTAGASAQSLQQQPAAAQAGPHASANGQPSSYERVHGVASRAPVSWQAVTTVAGMRLAEVLYDKGEGIAKVRRHATWPVHIGFTMPAEARPKQCTCCAPCFDARRHVQHCGAAPATMHSHAARLASPLPAQLRARAHLPDATRLCIFEPHMPRGHSPRPGCLPRAQVTINRPEKRNAFTPLTVQELLACFNDARSDTAVGAVILTGAGSQAFCSGGDQTVRGTGGYVGADNVPRLNVLDLQQVIRRLPKPVVCMVAGYAVGGGHILHMVCDLTVRALASRCHCVGFDSWRHVPEQKVRL